MNEEFARIQAMEENVNAGKGENREPYPVKPIETLNSRALLVQ